MTWIGIEGAVEAIAAYLTANIAAGITSVMAGYGDGLTPGTVAVVSTTELVEAELLANAAPVMAVIGDQTSVYQLDASSGGFRHAIAVLGTITDDSDTGAAKTNFRKRLYRLAQATAITVRAAQFDGINGSGFQIMGFGDPFIDYSPSVRRRGGSMIVGGFAMQLIVDRVEIG